MFTGIIETTGEVSRLNRLPNGEACLALRVGGLGAEMAVGESLAVNGCCLTVTRVDAGGSDLAFDLLGETLAVTNLGDLTPGALVNLERALLPGTRLSGHFVQGHVDDAVRILAVERRGQDTRFDVELPEAARPLIIPKGSIALDGISLTVADLQPRQFSVWIIPHTLQVTNLGRRQAGERLNVEYDLLGKYVRRQLDVAEPS